MGHAKLSTTGICTHVDIADVTALPIAEIMPMVANAGSSQREEPLAGSGLSSGFSMVGGTGLEPATPAL